MAILEQKTNQTNKKHNNTKYLGTFIKFRVVFVFHAAFMYIQPSVKKCTSLLLLRSVVVNFIHISIEQFLKIMLYACKSKYRQSTQEILRYSEIVLNDGTPLLLPVLFFNKTSGCNSLKLSSIILLATDLNYPPTTTYSLLLMFNIINAA